MTVTGRFAPSTTGPAHAGTLLAGLLAWLDIRCRGGRFVLRLEDLDPERCTPEWARALPDDLRWLGLDWDEQSVQSERTAAHEAALDQLAALGVLYPCGCSRSDIRALGVRAPDGGWRYDNRCRDRRLPVDGWRAAQEPLRVALPSGLVTVVDEGGEPLSQDPERAMGDPVVRRRDGAIAYNLAVVVDDAAAGVTRVVRGRDIAASTATQVLLQRLLGLATPVYRHHLLLLEPRGDKLAKLHGSVSARELRGAYTGPELLGLLAWGAGLLASAAPTAATELVSRFDWSKVRARDATVRWDGARLEWLGGPEVGPTA